MRYLFFAALGLLFTSTAHGQDAKAAQEKAVAKIKKLGGSVGIDETAPDKPVVKVVLSATGVTDAGLELLKATPKVKQLSGRHRHRRRGHGAPEGADEPGNPVPRPHQGRRRGLEA